MSIVRGGGDDATTVRSAGSGRSNRSARSTMPQSARSAAVSGAHSMHSDSYSYLSDRAYNFLKARSAWKQRAQSEDAGENGVQETLKVRINRENIEVSF